MAGPSTSGPADLPPGLRIAPARPEDADAVQPVVVRSVVAALADDWTPAAVDALLAECATDRLRTRIAEGAAGLVAWDGSRPVGFALLSRPGKLTHLFVEPHRQRHGVGRALWRAVHDTMVARWPAVDAIRFASTPVAVGFYRRMGAEPVGERFEVFGGRATRMVLRLHADPPPAAAVVDLAARGRLEDAALASWPAFEEAVVDGWRLRFAEGFTRRANSANPSADAAELDDGAIDRLEAAYRARGLRPVVRLPGVRPHPITERRLLARGWTAEDPSWVLATDLARPVPVPADVPVTTARVDRLDDRDAWLAVHAAVTGTAAADHERHARLVAALPAGTVGVAAWGDDGAPAACGLAVPHDGHWGLFDIATRVQARRRGLGIALCTALLEAGRRAGAHTAWLQVLAANPHAPGIYDRLGLRRADTYRYLVAPDVGGPPA